MLDLFIDGIAAIATPDTLALMILGVIVGIIFGSVPGLTAVTGIALFLPVTYSLGPIKGMALLMAIYIGAVSGGLIAAILINPARRPLWPPVLTELRWPEKGRPTRLWVWARCSLFWARFSVF